MVSTSYHLNTTHAFLAYFTLPRIHLSCTFSSCNFCLYAFTLLTKAVVKLLSKIQVQHKVPATFYQVHRASRFRQPVRAASAGRQRDLGRPHVRRRPGRGPAGEVRRRPLAVSASRLRSGLRRGMALVVAVVAAQPRLLQASRIRFVDLLQLQK